ncbi:MAG: sugar phosphate isomerase/epimerase [Rubricoccaceae bacterium]
MRIGWTTDTVTADASRALHYTLLWGLDGVVLRTIGKAEERVPFVNEGSLRRRLDADELPVFAIDPGLFEGDLNARASWMNEVDAFDDVASFCRRQSVPLVLAGALAAEPHAYSEAEAANAIRQLGDVATRGGVRIAIRNESGTAVSTGTALASLLAQVNHPAVKADWRPWESLRAGEDPGVGLLALMQGTSIACLTVHDEAPDGTPVIPGQGHVDWEETLRALAAGGWDGLVNLEVRGRPSGAFGLHAASAVISAVRRAKRAAKP